MHSTFFRVKWAVWEVDILHWSLFYNFFFQRLLYIYIYRYQHSPKRNDFVAYSCKQLFYLIGFRFYFLFFSIGKPIFFFFIKFYRNPDPNWNFCLVPALLGPIFFTILQKCQNTWIFSQMNTLENEKFYSYQLGLSPHPC